MCSLLIVTARQLPCYLLHIHTRSWVIHVSDIMLLYQVMGCNISAMEFEDDV
jgi:hypothetical protein